MLERNWGRIVNISSAHGLVASVNKSAYVASKHGVVGLTKVAALETAETGVTVNAIAPGWVLTPLVEAQIQARAQVGGQELDQALLELLAEKQPSRQFVTPAQIGELVVFLCAARPPIRSAARRSVSTAAGRHSDRSGPSTSTPSCGQTLDNSLRHQRHGPQPYSCRTEDRVGDSRGDAR